MSIIVWAVVAICVKVNILLQYIRIFIPSGVRNATFWASVTLICINCTFEALRLFLSIFNCNPRNKFWDQSIKTGHCLDWVVINTTGNAITLVTDLMIWLLPLRVIFGLQMKFAKKIGLSALFTLGVFALASSGLRLHYFIKLLRNRADTTFWMAKVCFFATTQLTAGFLVAALTSFPIFVNHTRKQPWAIRLGSSVKTLLHVSRSGSQRNSASANTTIGGNKHKHKAKSNVVTDVEFEELVNNTLDSVSMASVSPPEVAYGRRTD